MKKTAKIILYIAIVMFVLSLSSVLFAYGQELETLKGVQLNDGTVIHGRIIDMNVYRVIIDKEDGSRACIKFDHVFDFLKEDSENCQIEEKFAYPVQSDTKQAKKAIILEDVHFDFDKSTLTKDAQIILKRNVLILNDNPLSEIRIAGYTSAAGTEEYNQKLSERRARAVEEYLVNEKLIAPDRLSTIGYGKTRPAEHEADPKDIYSKAAMSNMRVLFEIIVKQGKKD